MDRLKNNLEIFVVSILLVGCNSKTQNVTIDNTSTDIQAQTIDIKFDEAIPISHVFNVTSSININEDTDHIMGSIQQMVVQGNTIYGIDPISHPGLYAYLGNGSQLFAYCKRGQGPEDLMSPMNMSISNNEISVFDFAEKKIMIFSKEGKYLESIELPIDALAAMRDSSGGIWIDFSNQDYDDVKLGYTNGSMDSIQCVLNVPDYLKGMTEVPMTNILSLADGELRYLPSMECGVYN